MIREYVGTVEGNTLAVYKRCGVTMCRKMSNGFHVAEIDDGRLNTVYFSRDKSEIDRFVDERVHAGFRRRR